MRDYPTKILLTNGEVINALRTAVATRLDIERKKRGLKHKDMLAFLRRTPGNERLAYGTYIGAAKGANNPTLKVIAQLAAGLDISISDFLFGAADAPSWTRALGYQETLDRLTFRLEALRLSLDIKNVLVIERIGLSGVTYARIKNGRHNASIDTIAVIARAFDLTPTEFLYASDGDSV